MAKYLIWLLFPISLLSNNAQAGTCSYSGNLPNGLPNLGTLTAGNGATYSQCLAVMCMFYPKDQGCPGQAPLCSAQIQQQTLSCPANYSGNIVQSRSSICPSGEWGDWQTISNTCTPNPPTCQPTTETQTLNCPSGYTGSITQTETSICPNPYGQPVKTNWVTSLNTCTAIPPPVQTLPPVQPQQPVLVVPQPIVQNSSPTVSTAPSNPTITSLPPSNPLSPVNPVSPLNPTAKQPTNATSTTTATATATQAAIVTQSMSQSTPSQPSPSSGSQPKSKLAQGLTPQVKLVESKRLEQKNLFPSLNLEQKLPNEIVVQNQVYLEIMAKDLQPQNIKKLDSGIDMEQ